MGWPVLVRLTVSGAADAPGFSVLLLADSAYVVPPETRPGTGSWAGARPVARSPSSGVGGWHLTLGQADRLDAAPRPTSYALRPGPWPEETATRPAGRAARRWFDRLRRRSCRSGEQGCVLGDAQDLSAAQGPTPWREGVRKQPDLADERVSHDRNLSSTMSTTPAMVPSGDVLKCGMAQRVMRASMIEGRPDARAWSKAASNSSNVPAV